jgi:hypothetical protein
VHDSGSHRCVGVALVGAGALESATSQQSVHERARGVTTRGMHHQSGRFVDHDQVRVFVQHLKHYARIRNSLAGRRLTRLDLELGSAADALLGAAQLAVHLDATLADPALHGGARSLWHQARHHLVDALGRLVALQHEKALHDAAAVNAPLTAGARWCNYQSRLLM